MARLYKSIYELTIFHVVDFAVLTRNDEDRALTDVGNAIGKALKIMRDP